MDKGPFGGHVLQGGGTMIKWIKPSGLEIETGDNDANIALAKSLGWVRAKSKEKTKPAKQPKVNAGGAKDGGVQA